MTDRRLVFIKFDVGIGVALKILNVAELKDRSVRATRSSVRVALSFVGVALNWFTLFNTVVNTTYNKTLPYIQ